ncbi:hypothetical protein [Paenibacillus montanisoli]|uniref:hypothetical protein n=1 Tax=Paenibacillus montanisoli TaxID=2081970 RepID=UPI0014041C7C|nr:hypothetical protein [Paenibacillus montanisoli]
MKKTNYQAPAVLQSKNIVFETKVSGHPSNGNGNPGTANPVDGNGNSNGNGPKK